MSQIYEMMVLIDNDVVRQDWRQAKAIVTDTFAKYDSTVHTCRRWDERRLAYPMSGKNRATYFLSYVEMPSDNIPTFLRDLQLNEKVLRSLMLKVDEVPEGEAEKAAAEEDKTYEVPAPPEDDAIELPEEAEASEGEGEKKAGGEGRSADKPEEKPEEKPEDKSDDEPGEAAAEEPGEAAAEKPAGETSAESKSDA